MKLSFFLITHFICEFRLECQDFFRASNYAWDERFRRTDSERGKFVPKTETDFRGFILCGVNKHISWI